MLDVTARLQESYVTRIEGSYGVYTLSLHVMLCHGVPIAMDCG